MCVTPLRDPALILAVVLGVWMGGYKRPKQLLRGTVEGLHKPGKLVLNTKHDVWSSPRSGRGSAGGQPNIYANATKSNIYSASGRSASDDEYFVMYCKTGAHV